MLSQEVAGRQIEDLLSFDRTIEVPAEVFEGTLVSEGSSLHSSSYLPIAEQPRSSLLAVRVDHPCCRAEVYLCFFTSDCFKASHGNDARLPKLLKKTTNTRVTGRKAVIVTKVLMDSRTGQTTFKLLKNDLPKRFATILGTGCDSIRLFPFLTPRIGFGPKQQVERRIDSRPKAKSVTSGGEAGGACG